MAETKDGRERVYVHKHTRNGQTVGPFYRTLPCPPAKPTKKK
jgi:hypothetical protein